MASNKIYTAQEMREEAKSLKDSGLCLKISDMLRQAADALEREEQIRREIKKIDTMEVAPLDGHPMHQRTNTEKVATILTFLPKVKKILGGAKTLEREESHSRKYEYAVGTHTGEVYGQSEDLLDVRREVAFVNAYGPILCKPVRRSVGEWEEVTDGD